MAGFSTSDDDRKKALADYDRAIALGVKDAALFVERSRARSYGSDSAGALADLNEALKLEPNNADYLRSRAGALEVLKRWKEAIADRTALLEQKPDATILSMRGADYVELKDWANAFGDFDKAIALKPDDADLYYDRAVAYRKKGSKEQALADFHKARTLSPDYPEIAADLSNEAALEKVRHNLGHMMRAVTKASEAMNDAIGNVGKAQRQKDKAAARLQRLLGGDKRTDEEILKSFDIDTSLGTLDEEDYLDRGRILAKQGKYDDAIADLSKAIALKKDFDKAYNLRGICYENKKEYEKAFADYDKAVSIQPKFSEYLRNRGDMHYQLQRFEQAWSDYDGAVQSAPKDAVNYFKRGNASFQRKNYDDAIADYDKALELDPMLEQAAKNREVAKRRKAAGG
ncbi:MAG: tetratricopeptide repeat protein [Armatimonas sp.]